MRCWEDSSAAPGERAGGSAIRSLLLRRSGSQELLRGPNFQRISDGIACMMRSQRIGNVCSIAKTWCHANVYQYFDLDTFNVPSFTYKYLIDI